MRANIAGVPRFHAVLASILAVTGAACTWGGAAGPVLLSITPAEAPNDVDVELVIAGRDFEPAIEVDFDRPGDSRADDGFAVTLVSGATRIALGAVERISSRELRATLAAGTPPGRYDVAVRDPRGRVATLRAAFTVRAEVAVTTSVDEADVGATPSSPGGAGFSLREAIAWANAQSFATTITIAAPRTITMTPPQTYMTLTAPGVAVIPRLRVRRGVAARRPAERRLIDERDLARGARRRRSRRALRAARRRAPLSHARARGTRRRARACSCPSRSAR